nr:branched-chain amino acid ABC transporter permease [Pseudomonas sp.]
MKPHLAVPTHEQGVRRPGFSRNGLALWEVALWLLIPAIVLGFFPAYYLLASQVATMALFAMSLDLLVGYAGIVSLGHAAFFGIGAYVAGLLAVAGWREPVTGLLMAGTLAGMAGFAISFVVVRVSHLTQLMVTLGVGLLVFEAATRMRWLTGGDDGLHGIDISPVLGLFEFDFPGRTAFVYAYVVLLACFLIFNRISRSPFGLALRGVRDNPERMAAIGTPVQARLRLAYTMAAVFAGIAGALLAQTTQFVSPDALSFHLSAEVLIMLVLGGAGYRYGGLVGAVMFILARDLMAGISPHFWQFGVGALMVIVVLGAPGGMLGGLAALAQRRRSRLLAQRGSDLPETRP